MKDMLDNLNIEFEEMDMEELEEEVDGGAFCAATSNFMPIVVHR